MTVLQTTASTAFSTARESLTCFSSRILPEFMMRKWMSLVICRKMLHPSAKVLLGTSLASRLLCIITHSRVVWWYRFHLIAVVLVALQNQKGACTARQCCTIEVESNQQGRRRQMFAIGLHQFSQLRSRPMISRGSETSVYVLIADGRTKGSKLGLTISWIRYMRVTSLRIAGFKPSIFHENTSATTQ